MATILGLDLGMVKSLACLYDPGTAPAHFTTVHTDPADLRKLLEAEPAPVLYVCHFRLVNGYADGSPPRGAPGGASGRRRRCRSRG